FFSSRRRHTRFDCDWSSDVCSSDLAVGTILVVAVAIVGSLTVLPAMLSYLGQKGWTEKGRVPYVAKLRHRTKGESRVWGAIIDQIGRASCRERVESAGGGAAVKEER